METLSCGHENDWSAMACALDANHARICKACANANELAGLRAHPKGFGYLSADSKTITDWGGMELARVVGPIAKSQVGYSATHLWTFRARMATGEEFACRHWPNAGDYVRLTRVKGS